MIGIIGDNGVAATNRLLHLIEMRIVNMGGYRDAHYPEIIAWQATQVPSRSMYLEGRGESFIPGYVDVGRKLKACGCNTAHYAINELEEQIGLPFINLLAAVASECNKFGTRRIGMMCSNGLWKHRLYDKFFTAANPAMQLIYPNDEMQRLVTRGICNAKNAKRNQPDSEEFPGKLFTKVCDWFIEQGVNCIVGGCTDISAVFSPSHWACIPYVDCLTVLATCIYERTSRTW